jgi:hypothetical protein
MTTFANNGHVGTFRVYPFRVTWQCSCGRSGRAHDGGRRGKNPEGLARAAWLAHTQTKEQAA